jgi:hypothetical protein
MSGNCFHRNFVAEMENSHTVLENISTQIFGCQNEE